MTVDLAPDLAALATTLGAAWPRTDEDTLYEAALHWANAAEDLRARGAALADLPAAADLPATATTADVLAGSLLVLAGVIAEYKHHTLRVLADLARFLTAANSPHADLLATTLARAALYRATHAATDAIDGPLSRVLIATAT